MEFKNVLKNRLKEDLPGWEAQLKMSPLTKSEKYRSPATDPKKASVMLLMFEEEEKIKCILIERAYHPEDKHSGQISLPGGQLEAEETYYDAAFREVEEELGIPKSKIEYLGPLSKIFVYVSNFMVQPYVGWLSNRPVTKIQDEEVASIIETQLEVFIDDTYVKRMDIPVRNTFIPNAAYYDIDGKVLWGATAMIMSEFSEIVKEIQI